MLRVNPCQWIASDMHIGYISGAVPANIQPNSLDVPLGVGSWMPWSTLPCGGETMDELVARHGTELREKSVLFRDFVYVFKSPVHLALPAHVSAMANPKSSAGRLDVHVRTFGEGCDRFDVFPSGYRGPVFVEVVSRSFRLEVDHASTLSQIRFLTEGSQVEPGFVEKLHGKCPIVRDAVGKASKYVTASRATLSLNLRGARDETIGYVVKRDADARPTIRWGANGEIDPKAYWDRITRADSIQLEPNRLYIFATHEKVEIPPELCAELVAFDPRCGELRMHYAGFFDSGFGRGNPSSVVLEIRNHHAPFLIHHGQRLFDLDLQPVAEIPERLYGQNGNHYQGQRLRLAKQFAEW